MLNARTKKSNIYQFDTIFENTLFLEKDVSPRIPVFRMSSAPFCSLKSIFEWYDYVNNVGTWSFRGDFYTGIGKAVHSMLQKWIPISAPAQILGHWRCLHCCKNKYLDECSNCTKNCKYFIPASVGPQICKTCGNSMVYQEFQYLLPNVPVSGHSDGILLYDIYTTLGINKINTNSISNINKLLREMEFTAYILEYKTTSKNKALYINTPITHHKAQATLYASAAHVLLKKYNLNLDIKGSIIKYISRESPDIRSRDFIVDIDNDFYKYNINMVKRTIKAILKDKTIIFPKKLPCSKEANYSMYYTDCPYTSICNEVESNKKTLNTIFEKIRKPFIKSLKEFKSIREKSGY